MKKIFISLGFLMMFILPVFAQNSHWEHAHSICGASGPITSAVTVVHSNGNAYLFQTDAGSLFVTELSPTNMIPSGPSYGDYIPDVILQGAYEDFNGDIVIYGSYSINNIKYPAAALYDVSTNQIINYNLDTNYIGDCFINGCCGYDIKRIVVNMMVLERAGMVVPIEWGCSSQSVTLIEDRDNGPISDVTWDSYNKCFAATGHHYSANGVELFLFGFVYNSSTAIPSVTASTAWNLPSYSFAEYRTNLEILDKNSIVVGQCIRDANGDWIWLTKINNYATIGNSAVFLFPAPKLFMSDMKYDEIHNRLTILGRLQYCNDVNYIAQIDPTFLKGMTAAYITGNMPFITCAHNQHLVYGNDIVLQKLEKNPHDCMQTIATGTYSPSNEVYITEVYDIASSQCDPPITISEQPASPQTGAFVENKIGVVILRFCTSVPLTYVGSLYDNNTCPDIYPCPKQEDDSVKNLFYSSEMVKATVDVKNGTLVFNGFSDKIDYVIYDAMGRTITTGITPNGTLSINLRSTGLYIIIAKDHYGNAITQKFVYTREQ